MTNEELDILWFAAMESSIKANEDFVRYRFADLVAAAEREACARLCEKQDGYHDAIYAAAIRARGEA